MFLDKDERKLFYTLFFISFLITFLEPNYLIGSVQGEFIYWLLISLLLKKQLTPDLITSIESNYKNKEPTIKQNKKSR